MIVWIMCSPREPSWRACNGRQSRGDVHDQRGRARLGELVLRARASRAAALIVVDFWLHLFIKEKVERNRGSLFVCGLLSSTMRRYSALYSNTTTAFCSSISRKASRSFVSVSTAKRCTPPALLSIRCSSLAVSIFHAPCVCAPGPVIV